MVEIATEQNFEDKIIRPSQTQPVLVEFFTQTCAPCKQIEPWLERIAKEMRGRVRVVKVDSNRAPNACEALGVRMAPTLFIFFRGQAVDAIAGKPPTIQRLYEFVGKYM